jgi:cysteine desulfurase/selenocysteine lyase
MRLFGVPATTRASFWLYSLPEEIDRLCDGLEIARKAYR